jgi:excisionase family DNA binding protein
MHRDDNRIEAMLERTMRKIQQGQHGPRLLNIQGVAHYLSSTRSFVLKLMRKKMIPFLIVGHRYVIDIRDLDAWIEKQKQVTLEKYRVLS